MQRQNVTEKNVTDKGNLEQMAQTDQTTDQTLAGKTDKNNPFAPCLLVNEQQDRALDRARSYAGCRMGNGRASGMGGSLGTPIEQQ